MERRMEILRKIRRTEVIPLRRAMVVAAAAMFVVGCSSAQAPDQVALAPVQAPLVGPPGYRGPAGPAGPQGPVGATGAPGYVMAGPAGAEGPMGPMGVQGPAGPMGAPGAVVAGARGATGDVGPAGMQGAPGETGAQGSSMVGPAGPNGPAGPAGAQGLAGQAGANGATLVGPTGPEGRSGALGEQGVNGETGAQGYAMAGRAGAAGPSGDAGAQGPMGPAGAQGQVGIVNRWTPYREITFDRNAADIEPSGMSTISAIARYMAQNPSLELGIDGSMDSASTTPANQDLSTRRVGAVRDALVEAGVPAYKIQTGSFGDPQLRRNRRVDVLLKTGV
jgi:outer membrane protein OmpA-like peptidoglycan-associated protein